MNVGRTLAGPPVEAGLQVGLCGDRISPVLMSAATATVTAGARRSLAAAPTGEGGRRRPEGEQRGKRQQSNSRGKPGTGRRASLHARRRRGCHAESGHNGSVERQESAAAGKD